MRSLDASLGFGRIHNDNRIDMLSGNYASQRLSLALTATGQYVVGETQLRPKLSASFTHFNNDGYDMAGTVAGIPVALQVAGNSANYGVAGAAVEANRVIHLSGGTIVVPYAELGVNYAFERPNDGQILTGNLTQATPSAWSGTLRFGARALVARLTFVELSAGYLSLGQNGLSVWEGRLFLSHGF